MWQILLRTFVFFTPIAAVALVLVRHVWEAVSSGAEINPWVLVLGSVLGWVSVQLTLIKFVDALGFEIWPSKKRGAQDFEPRSTGHGDRPASGYGDPDAMRCRRIHSGP
jgi:hypothetical protein